MTSEFPEHTNANYFLHTGSGLQGRPSMGAWVLYGLGSENENLPAYVVLGDPGGLQLFWNGRGGRRTAAEQGRKRQCGNRKKRSHGLVPVGYHRAKISRITFLR